MTTLTLGPVIDRLRDFVTTHQWTPTTGDQLDDIFTEAQSIWLGARGMLTDPIQVFNNEIRNRSEHVEHLTPDDLFLHCIQSEIAIISNALDNASDVSMAPPVFDLMESRGKAMIAVFEKIMQYCKEIQLTS